MKLDLKNSLKEGNDLLSNWKNKYSKTEYPEKIVLNIFYRKYTMEFTVGMNSITVSKRNF